MDGINDDRQSGKGKKLGREVEGEMEKEGRKEESRGPNGGRGVSGRQETRREVKEGRRGRRCNEWMDGRK